MSAAGAARDTVVRVWFFLKKIKLKKKTRVEGGGPAGPRPCRRSRTPPRQQGRAPRLFRTLRLGPGSAGWPDPVAGPVNPSCWLIFILFFDFSLFFILKK